MRSTSEIRGRRRMQSEVLRTLVQRSGVATIARFTVVKVVPDGTGPRATYEADEDGRATRRLDAP